MSFAAPLYLASRSPRRLQLLREAGFRPIVIDSGFDDSAMAPEKGVTGAYWTQSLALAKAKSAQARLNIDQEAKGTILAADTVCVLDSRIESQPTSRGDACRMLRSMRNARHPVITGIALLPLAGKIPTALVDEAWVSVGDVSDEQIDEYLASGDWQGKAGAYNLIERQQAGWPIRCDGDPATVMGLPLQRLEPLLAHLKSGT